MPSFPGSPNASSESGCTWYSRFACSCDGSLRVNAPSCEGAMLIGPLRLNTYSKPISALPSQLFAIVFSVLTPLTA